MNSSNQTYESDNALNCEHSEGNKRGLLKLDSGYGDDVYWDSRMKYYGFVLFYHLGR